MSDGLYESGLQGRNLVCALVTLELGKRGSTQSDQSRTLATFCHTQHVRSAVSIMEKGTKLLGLFLSAPKTHWHLRCRTGASAKERRGASERNGEAETGVGTTTTPLGRTNFPGSEEAEGRPPKHVLHFSTLFSTEPCSISKQLKHLRLTMWG